MDNSVIGSSVPDVVVRYFAYGSNMNPARVRARGLEVLSVRGARLVDVRLTFDKMSRDQIGVGHAALEFERGSWVEGVLYDLADTTDILKMDRFERTPINYSRELVQVQSGGTQLVGWTYFANRAVRRPGLRPNRAYLAHLLAGEPYLSDTYVRKLRALKCSDD